MLSKASSGSLPADSLCLDLEDSVAPGKKADARQNILKALNDIDAVGNKLKSEIVVRINPFGSGFEDDDLRVVFAGKRAPDAIAIPKVEHADQVKWLSSLLNFLTGDKERSSGQFTRIIAMIENPHGLIHLPSIVNTAPHRLVALIFGADDFAASIGASRASASMTEQSKQANDFNGTPLFRPNEEVSWARQSVVMHAKSANLQCIDVVQINYHDEALLVRECREGAALGYTGKQIIHPKQIAPTEQYFAPSADRISWAKRLVAAYDHNIAAGKGAFEFEGQMIDLPTVKIAQTIMRRAQSCGLA